MSQLDERAVIGEGVRTMGIDAQSFMDMASGKPCPECKGEGGECCDWQGLVWPEEPPLTYTDADRAYDRQAFAADYGLRHDSA